MGFINTRFLFVCRSDRVRACCVCESVFTVKVNMSSKLTRFIFLHVHSCIQSYTSRYVSKTCSECCLKVLFESVTMSLSSHTLLWSEDRQRECSVFLSLEKTDFMCVVFPG